MDTMDNIIYDEEVIATSVENDMEIAATEEICNKEESLNMSKDDEDKESDPEMEYAQILYRCTLCTVDPTVLNCKESYKKHFKESHHISCKNPIICYRCSLRFKTATDYDNHQIQKHVSSKLEMRFGETDIDKLKVPEIDPKNLPVLAEDDPSPTFSNSSLSSVTDASTYCCSQLRMANKRKLTTPVAIRHNNEHELDSFHNIIKEKLKPTLTGDSKKEADPSKKKKDTQESESGDEQNEKHRNEELKKYEPVWAEGGKKVIVKEEPMAGMTDSPLALLKSLKMVQDDHSKDMLPFPYPSPGSVDFNSLKSHLPLYKIKAPCHRCGFLCSNSFEYTAHLHSLHPGNTGDGIETYKLSVLRHHLTGVVEGTSNMNVSVGRYEVLEKLANQLHNQSLNQWGSCCNKAMKDLFPHCIAQRKGKDKHFYFGVKYIGSVPETVSKPIPGQPVELSPFRDLQHDTDALIKKLQLVIKWTGHMDQCVTRDTILDIMSDILQDGDVINWGTQCNRAVRSLFPMVFIKRKGKFKSCFFGVELRDDYKKQVNQPTFRKYNYYTDGRTGGSPVSSPLLQQQSLSPVLSDTAADTVLAYQAMLDRKEGEGGSSEGLESLLSPRLAQNKSAQIKTELDMGEAQMNSPEASDPNQRFVYQVNLQDSYLHPDSTGEQEVTTTPSESEVSETKNLVQQSINTPSQTQKMKASITRKQIIKNSTSTKNSKDSKDLETLKKSIILHPGPFVMARIIQRHFSGQKVSHVGVIVEAMLGLEHDLGMGIFYTMVHGKSKVFFKAVPDESLIKPLSEMGVRLEDYKFLFGERDTKLNDILHEKVKAMHPQLERLKNFYKY